MPCKSHCNCGAENRISNIIDKIRPVILWIDQEGWFNSMAFAIPLNKSRIYEDNFNEILLLRDYNFIHSNNNYETPMRAVIHQATRVDGNVLKNKNIIGQVTNKVKQKSIESKLFNWIFDNPNK